MHDDMWAPPPDPTRDGHSAYVGMPPPAGPPLPVVSPPPSYLLFGILTTVFCFLPFGIVSIVKGSSVASLWAQGRYAEAQRASRAARNWAIAAVVALPVVVVLFMAFLLTLLAAVTFN
jgi:hypothetical protein